jgi:hypothetical protein
MEPLHFEDEVEVEVLDNALQAQIDFHRNYDPGPCDDRDEVIQGHQDDADILSILLLRLQLQ